MPDKLEPLIQSHLKNLSLKYDEIKVLQVIAVLNRAITWTELNRIIPVRIEWLDFLEYEEVLITSISQRC